MQFGAQSEVLILTGHSHACGRACGGPLRCADLSCNAERIFLSPRAPLNGRLPMHGAYRGTFDIGVIGCVDSKNAIRFSIGLDLGRLLAFKVEITSIYIKIMLYMTKNNYTKDM